LKQIRVVCVKIITFTDILRNLKNRPAFNKSATTDGTKNHGDKYSVRYGKQQSDDKNLTEGLKAENKALKKRIEELEASEKKYSVLAKTAPVGIFNADTRGNTVYVNPYWCKITQIKFEEALGNGWLKAVHPDDIASLTRNWQNAVLTMSGSYAEYRFIRKDGTVAWVIGNTVPEFNNDGEFTGYIGTITDITERKMAEMKAEESDRLKTSFLNNISHEIRTPLNAITGFCAFLSDSQLSNERKESFANIIMESSDYLLSIIADIIDVAAIESGQARAEICQANANYILEVLHGRFLKRAGDRGNTLTFKARMPDAEAWIMTDKSKLNQALNNLICNSVKFTENGKIEFGYRKKGDDLEFYVKDSGIGIPEDMHDEIFKRFRQVEVLDSRRYSGTGLGLSIAKEYIEMLGGSIRVVSKPGQGSAFYLKIPHKRP